MTGSILSHWIKFERGLDAKFQGLILDIMTNNHGVVFLHGAGLDGTIWDAVRAEIHRDSFALNFPNRHDTQNANKNLSVSDYVDDAAQQIERFRKTNFVLVAHSVGGVVGSRLSEIYGDKITGFMGVGAVLPLPGKSFANCLPFPQSMIMPLLMKIAGTKPPAATIRKGLCHDLSETQTSQIIENFSAESSRLFTEKIGGAITIVPSCYVMLRQDREISVSLQKKMAARLASPHLAEMNTGHLPMLSNPSGLAQLINRFVDAI